jgi:antitoxin PrlF
MWTDPIVAELHRVRAVHAARFDHDLRAIAEDLKKLEQAWPAAKIDSAPLAADPGQRIALSFRYGARKREKICSTRFRRFEEVVMNCTMTSKGQVTVPKPLRDLLGLKPGMRVAFEYMPDGRVTLKPGGPRAVQAAEAAARLRTVRGSVKLDTSTDEYMNRVRGYGEDIDDPGYR